jgi:hypothetical protein
MYKKAVKRKDIREKMSFLYAAAIIYRIMIN